MAGAAVRSVESGSDPLAPAVLAAANINPTTRLATDYLNHFNNVVMLLDLLATMPECAEEVLEWQPLNYPAYFVVSHFRHRDLAVLAYESADPAIRARFDAVVAQLDGAMAEAQGLLHGYQPGDGEAEFRVHELVRGVLRPLIAEASGIINGTGSVETVTEDSDTGAAQNSIDELFP